MFLVEERKEQLCKLWHLSGNYVDFSQVLDLTHRFCDWTWMKEELKSNGHYKHMPCNWFVTD